MKAVPASRQRFDEARIFGGVSQSVAQLVDRRVQTVVEVNEGIGRPILGAQLFTSDHFAGPLQQDREHLERLFLEFDPCALLAQFSRAEVYLKHSEAQDCRRSGL
jgi:hypothetical protein